MHIIIDKAKKYQKREHDINFSTIYRYNFLRGFWENRENGLPLMVIKDNFRPGTKKADIETGEDRKGE